MKKFLSFVFVLVAALFAVVPSAFAVMNNNNGSITINNPIEGKKYSIYQILVLDSYVDVDGNTSVKDGEADGNDGYIYKLTSNKWADFVKSSPYFVVEPKNNTVTLATGVDVVQLAKDALAYAETNNITPESEKTAGKDPVVFSGLNLGYYLVDSSVGALCGLGTTSEHIIINEKNSVPTVNKDIVVYDSTGKEIQRVDANNTFIGKTVNYETTIDVGTGAQDYVLYDKMSAGLTFTEGSLTVKIGDTVLEAGANKDYTVEYNKDGYTFIITFVRTLVDTDNVVVSYSAVVNTNAVIGGTGNKNETRLDYGDEHYTESDTVTYTYRFELVKTDNNKTILPDAEFKLYDAETGGNRIYVVEERPGVYYVTQTANETVIKAGTAVIRGLANGTYYLEETRNPDGYTKLLARQAFTINNANIDAKYKTTTVGDANVTEYDEGGVQVVNTKGNLLPSTGGIGTTLFVVVGTGMVLLFGLLLVTKYRMTKEEN